MEKYNHLDDTSVLPTWMQVRPAPMSDENWDKLNNKMDKFINHKYLDFLPSVEKFDNMMLKIVTFGQK